MQWKFSFRRNRFEKVIEVSEDIKQTEWSIRNRFF